MQRSIYKSPKVDIIVVSIESGFAVSDYSQQEPSPWEDMIRLINRLLLLCLILLHTSCMEWDYGLEEEFDV